MESEFTMSLSESRNHGTFMKRLLNKLYIDLKYLTGSLEKEEFSACVVSFCLQKYIRTGLLVFFAK